MKLENLETHLAGIGLAEDLSQDVSLDENIRRQQGYVARCRMNLPDGTYHGVQSYRRRIGYAEMGVAHLQRLKEQVKSTLPDVDCSVMPVREIVDALTKAGDAT